MPSADVSDPEMGGDKGSYISGEGGGEPVASGIPT